MADLSVEFAGLKLKNPIIAGSCGLTNSVYHIAAMQENGASAIVLKSIFEEDITNAFEHLIAQKGQYGSHEIDTDYLDYKIKQDNVNAYLNLIKEAKKTVSIPVIASINCISTHEWDFFAEKSEQAGADAIELNIHISASDRTMNTEEKENTHFQIIEKITNRVKIPVIVKMSSCFTDLPEMIRKLSETRIKGLVLFNRYYSPDIDIYSNKITSGKILSNEDDYQLPLRWIALTSDKVSCDLAASTGIYNGESIIKQILAGASAVQVVSAMYTDGINVIADMLEFLEHYMQEKAINQLDEIKGKLSYKNALNPSLYERVQFMNYFGSKDPI
jgi:dihydroorotate dehydrogenase (fumarate)